MLSHWPTQYLGSSLSNWRQRAAFSPRDDAASTGSLPTRLAIWTESRFYALAAHVHEGRNTTMLAPNLRLLASSAPLAMTVPDAAHQTSLDLVIPGLWGLIFCDMFNGRCCTQWSKVGTNPTASFTTSVVHTVVLHTATSCPALGPAVLHVILFALAVHVLGATTALALFGLLRGVLLSASVPHWLAGKASALGSMACSTHFTKSSYTRLRGLGRTNVTCVRSG